MVAGWFYELICYDWDFLFCRLGWLSTIFKQNSVWGMIRSCWAQFVNFFFWLVRSMLICCPGLYSPHLHLRRSRVRSMCRRKSLTIWTASWWTHWRVIGPRKLRRSPITNRISVRLNCFTFSKVSSSSVDEFSPHIGYASLFPFLFGLVPHDSPKLEKFLHILTNTRLLNSTFGIRSLSRHDKYFGKDENYWRGPVWINVNFLTLRALSFYYTNKEGPYQARYVKFLESEIEF